MITDEVFVLNDVIIHLVLIDNIHLNFNTALKTFYLMVILMLVIHFYF